MRNGITGGVLVVIAVLILFVAYGSLYTVGQIQQALVVQLGKPVRVVTEPGLHVKIPLLESVIMTSRVERCSSFTPRFLSSLMIRCVTAVCDRFR